MLVLRPPGARLLSWYKYINRMHKRSKSFLQWFREGVEDIERCAEGLDRGGARVLWASCQHAARKGNAASAVQPILTGLYAEHLREWLQSFPAEQIMLLPLAQYGQDPGGWLSKVATFLGHDPPGLDSVRASHKNSVHMNLEPGAKEEAEAWYAPHAMELAEVLDEHKDDWGVNLADIGMEETLIP